MPTDRKSIKVIERYSRELARQAVIGIDATLKNRLVKVVSDKLDTALLVGKGQATNEVQTVTVNGSPTGGTFTLTFRGATTSGLAYNAAASTVQTALQGLVDHRLRQRRRQREQRRPLHRDLRRVASRIRCKSACGGSGFGE